MQCNVEFGYQLSIFSGTKENHGKPSSSWPVARPSGCKLSSSQQSGIKYASSNTSPYLCCCFIKKHLQVVFTIILCAYKFDKHQTVYYTSGRNERIFFFLCNSSLFANCVSAFSKLSKKLYTMECS
jgi:hypothetical protein